MCLKYMPKTRIDITLIQVGESNINRSFFSFSVLEGTFKFRTLIESYVGVMWVMTFMY